MTSRLIAYQEHCPDILQLALERIEDVTSAAERQRFEAAVQRSIGRRPNQVRERREQARHAGAWATLLTNRQSVWGNASAAERNAYQYYVGEDSRRFSSKFRAAIDRK
eukprot:1567647-Karenia_brevis.AAC.1